MPQSRHGIWRIYLVCEVIRAGGRSRAGNSKSFSKSVNLRAIKRFRGPIKYLVSWKPTINEPGKQCLIFQAGGDTAGLGSIRACVSRWTDERRNTGLASFLVWPRVRLQNDVLTDCRASETYRVPKRRSFFNAREFSLHPFDRSKIASIS